MSARIIIERKFKKPINQEMLTIINEIRLKAIWQRGYISEETVVNSDDDKDILVISSWSDVNNWKRWHETKTWKEFEKSQAPHLEGPIEIRIFIPAADYEKKFLVEVKDRTPV